MDCKESYGKVYSVGTSKKVPIKDLLKFMTGILPFDVDLEVIPGTPGDQFGIRANIDKIRAETGWEPKWDLHAGVREMVDYYLKKNELS